MACRAGEEARCSPVVRIREQMNGSRGRGRGEPRDTGEGLRRQDARYSRSCSTTHHLRCNPPHLGRGRAIVLILGAAVWPHARGR